MRTRSLYLMFLAGCGASEVTDFDVGNDSTLEEDVEIVDEQAIGGDVPVDEQSEQDSSTEELSELELELQSLDFSEPCLRHSRLARFVAFEEVAPADTAGDGEVIEDLCREVCLPHMFANPVGPPRDELFVFFTGTDPGFSSGEQTDAGPQFYTDLLRTAAAAGYHVIGLLYINDIPVNSICAGDGPLFENCHERVRQEIITGQDLWSYPDQLPDSEFRDVVVNRDNSIENRLIRLLQYLNWDAYLEADGETPAYGRIAFGGHSQGGGHAAMFGKLYSVSRVLMFDSTEGADWTIRSQELFSTPADRYYGLTSSHDVPIVNANLKGWGQMEIPGEVTSADDGAVPDGSSQQLITDRCAATVDHPEGQPPNLDGSCPDGGNEHGTTSLDEAVPRADDGEPVFRNAWCFMMDPGTGPQPPVQN